MAIVENLDGITLEEFVGEFEVSHVGSASRTINRKETEPCAGDVIELTIAMRHQLIGLLRCCIERNGIVHAVIGAERHFLISAIHAGTGCIHKVLYGVMPTSFENIVETNDVALNIHIRVINAITYSCLSCEVHDNVKLVFLEQFVDQFAICYATLDEMIVKSEE